MEAVAVDRAASELREAIEQASTNLVERKGLVETIALAAVAGEHVLVIGPPGTAKSEAVRRIARATGGKYFEYLISRFTEPSEIFGPVDLRKLREGIVEAQTGGMLPEAEVAFLDEIFLGSTAILNTLLGILNERVFRRGHMAVSCPLRICVGAANRLPENEQLAAFGDRFLVRVFADPIPDSRLEDLLEGGWTGLGRRGLEVPASMSSIDHLAAVARTCELTAVRPHLATAIRILRSNGVNLTDRRIVKTQQLIAAAAVLAGRTSAAVSDLWPLVMAVPEREEQSIARQCLSEILKHAENEALSTAAEETSLGPVARAQRIAGAAKLLFEQAPGENERQEWLLRLEGIAREIDACFAPATLTVELSEVRARIVSLLKSSGRADAN